jgi:hypothetical protein
MMQDYNREKIYDDSFCKGQNCEIPKRKEKKEIIFFSLTTSYSLNFVRNVVVSNNAV